MNKKTIIWIVAAVLAVGAAVAAFMFASNGSSQEEAKSEETMSAAIVAYVDFGQLAEKGALENYITPENRKLLASTVAAQLGGTKEAKQLKDIITNLDALGIDTQSPLCCYVNTEMTDVVFVAKVLDVEKIDSSIELLSYFLEESGEEPLVVNTKGGVRTIDGYFYAVAYNASTFAIACGSDTSLKVAQNAISTQMDLSKFAGKDIAVMLNVDSLKKVLDEQMNNYRVEYEELYEEDYITKSQYNEMLAALDEYDEAMKEFNKYFEPNANIIISLTFDLGRATLAFNVNGVKNNEYMDSFKTVNLAHLNNLSKDTYAVMGMGVNGERFAKYLEDMFTDDMLKSLGIRPTSDVRMAMSIAADAISSIDGDITLALDSIDGTIKWDYDYYWEEYYSEPEVNSVDAMLMVDVNDSYIINNVGQFAGGFFNKIDKNHYSLYYDGYDFNLGQDDGLLYAGVNMTPKSKRRSAMNADWAKDVEGSLNYMVVNIDALLANSFIREMWNDATNLSYEESLMMDNFLDMFSYAYIASSLASSELVLVFDDQDTNALEQISDAILPFLIDECVENLY